MVLLARSWDKIPTDKKGKVKERGWNAAKNHCLGNVNEYILMLKSIKADIDEGKMHMAFNMREVQPYVHLEHFKPEVIASKSSVAAGLCAFVVNIVKYYDITQSVETKRDALAAASAAAGLCSFVIGIVTYYDLVMAVEPICETVVIAGAPRALRRHVAPNSFVPSDEPPRDTGLALENKSGLDNSRIQTNKTKWVRSGKSGAGYYSLPLLHGLRVTGQCLSGLPPTPDTAREEQFSSATHPHHSGVLTKLFPARGKRHGAQPWHN